MTLTAHILAGAIIGEKINNPYLIAISALAFHFVFDAIPHGDYINKKSTLKDSWKVFLDFLIGITLLTILLSLTGIRPETKLGNIILAVSFSLLPDFTSFLHRFCGAKFLSPIKNFHESLHRQENGSFERAFTLRNSKFELIILLISTVLILYF
jgi:hypothetical protein